MPFLPMGSLEEIERYEQIQKRLPALFERQKNNTHESRTVIVIPSLSLDEDVLKRIAGIHHYEERLLCFLMLLRLPRTNVIYVTSQPVDPTIIDYYLHLLPGIPVSHARKRLTLLSCHDASPTPLSLKILHRPRLIDRIRAHIPDPFSAHLTCFNTTFLERTLAVRLNVALYAANPSHFFLATKSGSRLVFAAAGVKMPEGYEDLRDRKDILDALYALKRSLPCLSKAVVKLNEGFSGEGNAMFFYRDSPDDEGLKGWLRDHFISNLQFEADGESFEHFVAKYETMGGIVERFIDGEKKRSPSAQCEIDPLGRITPISTHDQVLGGPSGQIFLGCTFPADETYRQEIQQSSIRVAEVLCHYAVMGRLGVDFVSTWEHDRWEQYAIEINLRKGGTTHPFMMLQFLIDGEYEPDTGLYLTPSGHPRFYHASDNLENAAFRGLCPEDLIDISVHHHLHFHGASQQGVVFHLIGALSEYGKLGVVCIGDSLKGAKSMYRSTCDILNQEALLQEQKRQTVYP